MNMLLNAAIGAAITFLFTLIILTTGARHEAREFAECVKITGRTQSGLEHCLSRSESWRYMAYVNEIEPEEYFRYEGKE